MGISGALGASNLGSSGALNSGAPPPPPPPPPPKGLGNAGIEGISGALNSGIDGASNLGISGALGASNLGSSGASNLGISGALNSGALNSGALGASPPPPPPPKGLGNAGIEGISGALNSGIDGASNLGISGALGASNLGISGALGASNEGIDGMEKAGIEGISGALNSGIDGASSLGASNLGISGALGASNLGASNLGISGAEKDGIDGMDGIDGIDGIAIGEGAGLAGFGAGLAGAAKGLGAGAAGAAADLAGLVSCSRANWAFCSASASIRACCARTATRGGGAGVGAGVGGGGGGVAGQGDTKIRTGARFAPSDRCVSPAHLLLHRRLARRRLGIRLRVLKVEGEVNLVVARRGLRRVGLGLSLRRRVRRHTRVVARLVPGELLARPGEASRKKLRRRQPGDARLLREDATRHADRKPLEARSDGRRCRPDRRSSGPDGLGSGGGWHYECRGHVRDRCDGVQHAGVGRSACVSAMAH